MAAAGTSPHHAALLGASSDVLTFASTPIPYGAHIATVMSDGKDLDIWAWDESSAASFVFLRTAGGSRVSGSIPSAATPICGWTT